MRNWILFIAALFNIMMIPQGMEGAEKEKIRPGISWPAATEGWKWDGKEEIYESRAIFDYIDGAGEVYLAYHFKNLMVRQLEKTGYPRIIAELYDMGSSNDAYGIFSLERQDEEAGIGQGSEFGGGLLRFWKGKFFVSVYADGEGPEVGQTILRLGQAIANSIQATGQAPKLISALPVVKGKTRLNILCALQPQFYGRGASFFDRRYTWPYKGLLLGADPVAVDAVGAHLLQKKRIAFFGEERELDVPPTHINVADKKYHLGVSDLNRIHLIKLGWMEDVLI